MIAHPGMSLQAFAEERLKDLLDALVFALRDATILPDVASVHKARVAIRRFQQALRVFSQYVPEAGSRKVRGQIREIMDYAGEVRNRDIAIELLAKEGRTSEALMEQRRLAKRRLTDVLRDISRPDVSIRWRTRLGLHG